MAWSNNTTTSSYTNNTTTTTSTSYSYSYTTSDHSIGGFNMDTLLGCMSILYMLVGTPGNALSFSYFLARRSTSASTFLYLSMNAVDGVICLLMLPVAVASFRGKEPVLFENTVFCNVWSIFWNVGTRLSIFLIGLLSIARAISIIFPLRWIGRRSMISSVIVYTTIISLQQTLPYWYRKKAVYCEECAACSWSFPAIFDRFSIGHQISVVVFIQLEYLLPVVPIVASGILLVVKLTMDRRNGMIRNTKNRSNVQASRTIIMLTIAFLIFNAPFLVIQQMYTITVLTSRRSIHWDSQLSFNVQVLLAKIFSTHLIVINSCVNPLIYFIRIRDLRNFTKMVLRCRVVSEVERRRSSVYVMNGARQSTRRNTTPYTMVESSPSPLDGKSKWPFEK